MFQPALRRCHRAGDGAVGAIASDLFRLGGRCFAQPAGGLLDRWGAGQWRCRLAGSELARIDLVPGENGSALLALALVAVYVPGVTFVAWQLGRLIERLSLERQRRDGAWRAEWGMMLGRVSQPAAARGERAKPHQRASFTPKLTRPGASRTG